MSGRWTQEKIADKTVDFFDPSGSNAPRFAILFLHDGGLETLVDKPTFTGVLDKLQLGCACPHGKHSWWTDHIWPAFDPRLTAEQHVIRNVLPVIHQRWQLGPRAVGLLGISMGGQGALRHSDQATRGTTRRAPMPPATV